MTSRLKRKLNDLGVDPTSTKANESFCLIGTPLPPLEKSKDTGEFVPLWKQEVRDEKGRRRLHGAFTGGFSAGYFNSVGSKEGWTPSTFVSSRSERAKQKAARPEDFMDEEDLEELRESRKLVDEHDEMDFGGTEAELRRKAGALAEDEPDSITSALAASLAPAPKDSVGARILKKMGWRVGQGVGPRLTYAQKKAQDVGVLDPTKETTGEGDDEEAGKHLYPRRDTPVLFAPRKDNFHGVGYVPGVRLDDAVAAEEVRGKGPRIAAGFGLGALNDADDDDLDVYDGSVGRQNRGRMAFDMDDTEDDHKISIGPRGRGGPQPPQRNTVVSSVQTFNDGQTVLKGFVLSERPVAEDRWFALPDVPKGWSPNPRRVWEQQSTNENADPTRKAAAQPPKTHQDWKSSFKSADERGSILGETPLPSQPRSIFEYMSQKDRERLQNLRNTVSQQPLAPGAPPPAPAPERVSGQLDIPQLHPSIAKAALQGFQPFTADPVKQSRYMSFLHFQTGREVGAQLGMGPLPGQSTDEFSKELSDYAKAATVFKPLSGAMAGRFQSAAVVEMGPKVVEGLHRPDFTSVKEEEQKEEEKKDDDPRMSAVRLGMYGPLTREVQPWLPAKLLCKRFGVKEPEVDMGDAAPSKSGMTDFTPTATAKESEAAAAAAAEASAAGVGNVAMITDGSEASEKKGPRDLTNIGLGEDEHQGRDTLTYQRPAMDIFKAIFASDDEDSEDEGEEDAPAHSESPAPGPAEPQVKAEPVPAHLRMEGGEGTFYDAPKVAGPSNTVKEEKVDLATFRPTFVSRAERDGRIDKGSKKKDKDKKKKSKALMSFDVDDGEQLNLGAPEPKRHKEKDKNRDKDKDGERKKKKRKEHKGGDEDDSMWVEAPPSEAVKNLAVEPPTVAPTNHNTLAEKGTEMGPPRGRKRAIDFM